MKNRTVIVKTFISLIITSYLLVTILGLFPGLDIMLQILVGLLIFSLISTAVKFLPIEEIINKVL